METLAEKPQESSSYQLTDAQVEEVACIPRELGEAKGRLATDEEMTSLWKSCGL